MSEWCGAAVAVPVSSSYQAAKTGWLPKGPRIRLRRRGNSCAIGERSRGTQSGNAVGEYIGEDPVFGMGAVMPSRTMWCRCGVGVDVVGVVYVPVLALSIIDI
jgi:hypothetical protein